MKKKIIAALALAASILLTSCNVIINKPDTTAADSTDTGTGEVTTEPVPEVTYAHSDMELAPLEDIIATTEHQQIPVSTFRYFFMDNYNSFINSNYYYLSYYGLDPSVPLHDQTLPDDETKTWYDIFLDNGKSAFEQYAKFAEMAIKEGLTLDDDDDSEIEAYLDSIDSAAKDLSMTFEEYMSDYMGEGMSREKIKAALQLSQLGYKYYQKIYNETEYSDEQIEKEYEDGKGKYSLVDYYRGYIEALYDETDDDVQADAARKEALDKAEKIKSLVASGTGFNEAYYSVMGLQNEAGETTGEDGDETKPADLLITRAVYSDKAELAFLYDSITSKGQVGIYTDDEGNVTVIQCVKLPYKNTMRSVNVRHILLSSSDYNTEEDAYKKAQELLAEIDSADDKKEKFISLVAEFSSDPGSVTNGGLYEGVMPGDMVEEFNDWCFDTERQVGDTGIVLTDYGYHVMYLDGFGDEIWRANCVKALRDAEFTAKAEAVYDSVSVTYNEEMLDKITK